MEGLNKTQLEYRIHNGLVNNENIKNSRSIKDIILSNTITLFNLLHIVLFILVLTTGSLVNATFIASIFFNTIIGIYQEIKAKIIIDKLKSDFRMGKGHPFNQITDIACFCHGRL